VSVNAQQLEMCNLSQLVAKSCLLTWGVGFVLVQHVLVPHHMIFLFLITSFFLVWRTGFSILGARLPAVGAGLGGLVEDQVVVDVLQVPSSIHLPFSLSLSLSLSVCTHMSCFSLALLSPPPSPCLSLPHSIPPPPHPFRAPSTSTACTPS
jgi:hypothetical protein